MRNLGFRHLLATGFRALAAGVKAYYCHPLRDLGGAPPDAEEPDHLFFSLFFVFTQPRPLGRSPVKPAKRQLPNPASSQELITAIEAAAEKDTCPGAAGRYCLERVRVRDAITLEVPALSLFLHPDADPPDLSPLILKAVTGCMGLETGVRRQALVTIAGRRATLILTGTP